MSFITNYNVKELIARDKPIEEFFDFYWDGERSVLRQSDNSLADDIGEEIDTIEPTKGGVTLTFEDTLRADVQADNGIYMPTGLGNKRRYRGLHTWTYPMNMVMVLDRDNSNLFSFVIGDSGMFRYQHIDDDEVRIQAPSGTTTTFLFPTNGVPFGTKYVLWLYLSGTTGRVWIDGNESTSGEQSTGTSPIYSELGIGSNSQNADWTWYEMGFKFGSVSDAERIQATNLLMTEHGI